MKEKIVKSTQDAICAIEQLKQPDSLAFIEAAAHLLAQTFEEGNKTIVAGNGGSLCDAAHFAEELTGNFRSYRRALPAIALSEPGHITCVGNDMGFEYIFSRGVEAFGKPGDIFIGLTTSGRSPNMIHAFEIAKQLNLKTIAFLGKGGGQLKNIADLELCINGFASSDRIQEAHKVAFHIIIEMMETILFPESDCSFSLEKLIKKQSTV